MLTLDSGISFTPSWELKENKTYIIVMPFIDTKKLHRLNIFFNSNEKAKRKIDIVTLGENKEKINEILKQKVNIVEIDNYINNLLLYNANGMWDD